MVMRMNVEGRKGRGRPKTRWLNTVENDMRTVADVCVGNVEDRDKWRSTTRVANPPQIVERKAKENLKRRNQFYSPEQIEHPVSLYTYNYYSIPVLDCLCTVFFPILKKKKMESQYFAGELYRKKINVSTDSAGHTDYKIKSARR